MAQTPITKRKTGQNAGFLESITVYITISCYKKMDRLSHKAAPARDSRPATRPPRSPRPTAWWLADSAGAIPVAAG
ncbi:hypothetical protein, partial [Novosphingobium sp. B-7]|uniref:hypothetical protein n=1 Tax=Novosphingobium sp. B-7 TaxID=1298855 RepID=UPI001ED9BD01